MLVAGKKAKVTFDYDSQDQDELTLKMDDIVDILSEEEPGWWKGQLGNKIGVFPSNFVEIIDGNDIVQSKDKPVETQRKYSGLLLYAKKMLECNLVLYYVSVCMCHLIVQFWGLYFTVRPASFLSCAPD